MCGIAGIVGKGAGGIDPSSINAMILSLRKRGPDEQGSMVFPNCVLGHTRLSILDLATGHQPMRDNRKNVAITFNGEIYNFQEITNELVAKGHMFSTKSDTEVILKAYLEYGTECPRYLDGMFAFGIWDDDENLLFMARDRFGKKPLYYAFDDTGNFVFASEIKALLQSGLISGVVDHEAIDSYLRLMYIPPSQSVYKNVQVVKPAESMTVRDGKIHAARYWWLEHRPMRIGFNEAKQEVRNRLLDAVRKRMVADVEIGALLSGGVDSTIITEYSQRCVSRPIKTFSIGYGDYINELPYSKAASERIGTEHYTLQVGGAGLADDLQEVAEYFDEPHADSSNVSQFLVSRLARSKVKVALCGDGGDEVFLGYDWYWRHTSQGRAFRLRQALFSSPFRDYIHRIQIFEPEERMMIWNGYLPDESNYIKREIASARLGSVGKINLFDLSVYLPGQLLVKADRAGMMNSLEVRSPFLDYKLAEFVFNLPLEYKTNRDSGKLILKDLLTEVMPYEFVNRRKQGFGAPVLDWLKTICQPLVRDLFAGGNTGVYTIMNRRYISQLIDRFYAAEDFSCYYKIWVLLCLELWFKTHRKAALTG